MTKVTIFCLLVCVLLAANVVSSQQPPFPTSIKIIPCSEIKKPHLFDVSWVAPGGIKIKGYYYKLDLEAKTRWTSETSIKGLRVVGGGQHYFYLAACDVDDNISPYVVVPFSYIHPAPKGGQISLTEPDVYPAGGSPGITAIGDVNNDGLNDVACANYYDNNIGVFIQLPGGKLASQTTYEVAQGPFGVGIGDINRDGLNEVVVGCAAADVLYIFTQNEGGTLSLAATYPTARGPYGLDIVDINGDGRNDIILANSGGLSMSVFTWVPDNPRGYQTLLGSFADCHSLTMQKETGNQLFGHLIYPSGPTSFWTAGGDMNGDGRADAACVNYSNNTLNLYIQQPDGGLKAAGALSTVGSNPTVVCMGDINGDGLNEVMTSSDPVSIYGRKEQDNTFGLIGTQTTTDGKTGGIKAGDMNNDGRLDLICTQAKNVSIFLQDNNGRLLPPTHYYAGDIPGGLSVGDVNDDGLNDVITGNIKGNSISVLHPIFEKKKEVSNK